MTGMATGGALDARTLAKTLVMLEVGGDVAIEIGHGHGATSSYVATGWRLEPAGDGWRMTFVGREAEDGE